MNVTLNGAVIRVPAKVADKGGEADIFDLGNGQALKIFKPPTHPDFAHDANAKAAAAARIAAHQTKLRQFPGGLPAKVVVPAALATDPKTGAIVGYAMRFVRGAEVLLRYGVPDFRKKGVPEETMLAILRDLAGTVAGVHTAGVVIGDFNDLNVLVLGSEAYLIDSDSFQWGSYLCAQFTEKFVDPLLCDPNAPSLTLVRPHTPQSDWYAYTVMAMNTLLFVDPYGGVYKPKAGSDRLTKPARPLKRVTVFHPDVRYPKPAVPLTALPDDLLQHFYRTFVEDRRERFPLTLLDGLRYTTCTVCQTRHCRAVCPACSPAAAAAIRTVTRVRGTVTATRVFRTAGTILATAHHGKLRWLSHENETYRREDGTVVLRGPLLPAMRFRISGTRTLVGTADQFVVLEDGAATAHTTELFRTVPVFSTNEKHWYWCENGQLLRNGVLGPERIGSVVQDQTLIWTGETFGIGLTTAANYTLAFCFDAEKKGVNDNVQVPPIRGQLIDATAVFGALAWLFTATQEHGKTVHRCAAIERTGTVLATAEAQAGDGSWLSSLRGKCGIGKSLLAATDDGIVRVEMANGTLEVTKTFPDTEPFVDASCHLVPLDKELAVVTKNEIRTLAIR